jgi:hypothetical protein
MMQFFERFGTGALRWLTIGFWAVLALLGGLRLWQSLALRPYLAEVNVQPGPLYLTLTGAAQMLAAGLALAAYLSRWRRGGQAMRLLAALWVLGFWIDRTWVATSPAVRVNDAFVAVFLAAWLLILWAATSQQK